MPTTLTNMAAKAVAGDSELYRKAADWVPELPTNVGDAERWGSLVGGALLAGWGLSRDEGWAKLFGVLVGGSLIARGVTGHCAMYRACGINTACGSGGATIPAEQGVKVEHGVVVNKPAAELYRFWRKFDNLARFMDHLQEVRILDDKRSHWVAKAPLGMTVEWDAEVYNERYGELIAWRSLPGSDVDTSGSVHFTPARGGHGTEVRVSLKYLPPAGKLGAAVARFFGESPEQQVRDDLERFKRLMESGSMAAALNGR